MESQGLTRPHEVAQGRTRSQKISQGPSRSHKVSQGLTWPHKATQGLKRGFASVFLLGLAAFGNVISYIRCKDSAYGGQQHRVPAWPAGHPMESQHGLLVVRRANSNLCAGIPPTRTGELFRSLFVLLAESLSQACCFGQRLREVIAIPAAELGVPNRGANTSVFNHAL